MINFETFSGLFGGKLSYGFHMIKYIAQNFVKTPFKMLNKSIHYYKLYSSTSSESAKILKTI